ncbi:hypothetical protein LCGC14_2385980 [marine sediment metagenome]|uniref:Uncharacterized protein n=1 Tax=marine sediment metagenome TaxID=412755 RepID=A0A0F9EBY5_9ZZZZ
MMSEKQLDRLLVLAHEAGAGPEMGFEPHEDPVSVMKANVRLMRVVEVVARTTGMTESEVLMEVFDKLRKGW